MRLHASLYNSHLLFFITRDAEKFDQNREYLVTVTMQLISKFKDRPVLR